MFVSLSFQFSQFDFFHNNLVSQDSLSLPIPITGTAQDALPRTGRRPVVDALAKRKSTGGSAKNADVSAQMFHHVHVSP
jgi:hypothetical protein